MVTAGLHATAMGPKGNCSSDKQWYSLVKLDPYGLGHGSCDGELAELEELILSEPDHRVLDDATGFTGLSDGDANSQFSDDAGDDARDEYRSVHAYKTQPQAYQKPGGPCDHCGAVGTYPATNLHHAFFFARAPEPFFPDGARGSPRGDAPHRRCDRERPDRAVTPRRPRPSRIESDLYRPAPSTLDPQTRPSGGGVPRPSRCSATPVAPVTGGRTTSGPRPRWVAWPRRWRPKRGRPPDLLRRRSTRRRNTGARRPRSRASRTFVPTPCARDGSWLSWCRLSKGKGRDGDR